jgi:aspartate kinase
LRIIVQKFGGTSVATPERRQLVADRVAKAAADGFATVVVVSAMGRSGEPYATDTLIQLAHAACPETAPREMDLLLSCGEIISAVVMAGTLRARSLPAVAMTGGQAGIRTDGLFGDARILSVDPAPLLRRLREGNVVVVAGFQGLSEDGEVTTLGRGGSDTTAAALGGSLRAEVVEIYTDVDGVKTADPRIVPEARTLPVTTYDEIAQMAHYGAKVVHPRAVEIAMLASVPIRVKSTFDDTPGTLITFNLQAAGVLFRQGVVTGVTHVPGLARVRVPTEPGSAFGLTIFRALADAGVSVDMINVSPEMKAFCIDEAKAERAGALLRSLGFEPAIRTGCAKVSIVGAGMRGRPGVMATMAEALLRAQVEILQTADSHVTISALVMADEMERAVRALHEAFGLAEAS